jgi:signal transduction histidine kinase
MARTGMRALSITAPYGGLIMVERPVRLAVLASTVGLAPHGRRQQYRIRDLLAERAGRIRERDEFVALISHELRNPFAAISLCAELLNHTPPDDGSAHECRQMILRQTQDLRFRVVGE